MTRRAVALVVVAAGVAFGAAFALGSAIAGDDATVMERLDVPSGSDQIPNLEGVGAIPRLRSPRAGSGGTSGRASGSSSSSGPSPAPSPRPQPAPGPAPEPPPPPPPDPVKPPEPSPKGGGEIIEG